MIENTFKLHAEDALSLAFEMQRSIFQMQNIWLSLLLGASSHSSFIDDYKCALKNSQSRGGQRNRRSYDQPNFEMFNIAPSLYLDYFNEVSKLYAPINNSPTQLNQS